MSAKTLEGWHFLAEDGRLRWGTKKKVRVGKTLRIKEEPVLCQRGFHASVRPLDALQYAPGPIVCRVRLSGVIVADTDKHVAQERTVIWRADATRTLHEFAIWCARRALKAERKAGREPDARSWRALEVKSKWLAGEATDTELAAAWAAAWDAARDAARAAARDAARDAARAAAWAAAWAAARDAARAAAWAAARAAAWAAARDAAWDAARDAARDAAWAAAWAAARDAAWDAAWAAAWDAAWDAQNRKLTQMLRELAPTR